MTLDDFATITRRVIARDGFDGFLPTFCYPARRRVTVLEGYSEEIVPEAVVLERAAHGAEKGEEFLVAFKLDADHFRIIRREGDMSESGDYMAAE